MDSAVRSSTTSSAVSALPARHAARLTCVAVFLATLPMATAQEWIEFMDETCRLEAALSMLNDIPCDQAACEQAIRDACEPFFCGVTCDLDCICEVKGCPGCDPECMCDGNFGSRPECCACEKDMVVGDLNNDQRDDVVIVRKQPYYVQAGASNLLFMNENRVLVDRTGLAPGFADITADRDVVIADINGDGFDEVITAPTLGQPPRVYVNQGCDGACTGPACDPGGGGGNWCGLVYEPARLNNDTFVCDGQPCKDSGRFPWLCGIAAGDVNGDFCPDLYLGDYGGGQNRLFDRLLINIRTGGVCTGFFVDETDLRMCNGGECLNEPQQDPPAGTLTTGAQIIDIDGDLCPDIVQSRNREVNVVYNIKTQNVCTGFFQQIEHVSGGTAYMSVAGDFNNDDHNDLYVGTDGLDKYRVNQGDGTLGPEITIESIESPRTNTFAGNVRIIDMNRDNYGDPVVSDVDIQSIFRIKEFAILRSEVLDPEDPLNMTLTDPIPENESKPWNKPGTYDTAVVDVDLDGELDLWIGARGNEPNLFFRQGGGIDDCDNNGVPDACDVADGARDCNADIVPDECCIEDLDFDGQVNPVDSGMVQANFGCLPGGDPCSECTRSDIDKDGQVNPVDAGLVQQAFGTCGSLSPFGGGGGDGPPPPMMPWQFLRADLSFELQPLGGGDPVRVLAANTEYEVHYSAGHDRVNGFALYGIGMTSDQGFADARPPAAGPWTDTWNDLYVHLKRGEGERIPAYGHDETEFRNDLAANNLFPADPDRYGGAQGMLGVITTRSGGDFDLHLYVFWLDPQAQLLVLMESAASFNVR